MKITNKMQQGRLIYHSQSALRVSGDVFPLHQEHLTVLDELKLLCSFTSSKTPAVSDIGEHYQML
jgi:hypothetical protein